MIKINESNITIMVKDMDRAINFYTSIGQKRWGNHYTMVTAEGITIGLHPRGKDSSCDSHLSIGFMIDNAHDAKKLFEKNKITYQLEEEDSGIYVNLRTRTERPFTSHSLNGVTKSILPLNIVRRTPSENLKP